MSSPFDVAVTHQAARIRLTQSAVTRALTIWRAADVAALDASWNVVGPVMVDAVAEHQIVAAAQADKYLDGSAEAFNRRPRSGRIVPEAFADVMPDGRSLGAALYGGVTTTKTLIGRGMAAPRAFEAGAGFLAAIVQTAMSDMGRQADRVSATAKGWTRYVRVLSPGACSRCAILSGKAEYSVAFKRHPSCKCTSMMLPEGTPTPRGLFDNADDYFDSLSKSEQDRVFTSAGAQAIRDGADPVQVVNARRGAVGPGGPVARQSNLSAPLGYDLDGKPIKVFVTPEGSTAKGAYGRAEMRRQAESEKPAIDRYRRTTSVRLMPETLYSMARGDQRRAVELLTQYGYIS